MTIVNSRENHPYEIPEIYSRNKGKIIIILVGMIYTMICLVINL